MSLKAVGCLFYWIPTNAHLFVLRSSNVCALIAFMKVNSFLNIMEYSAVISGDSLVLRQSNGGQGQPPKERYVTPDRIICFIPVN